MAAAPESAGQSEEASAKIPLKLRLKAWWEGYDLEVRQKQSERSDEAAQGDEEEQGIKPFERWDEAHLELLRTVWDGDFVTPGGNDYILQLVKPFGLNPAMSMVELGAGSGGAARLMAKDFGVWITGMEGERKLADAGMALSEKAGLEKKAPIVHFDPQNFELKAKSFDCIFSKEFFYTVQDKERLVEALEFGMKENGQLLFTDYVLAKEGGSSQAIDDWAAGEYIKPHPWSMEQYVRELTNRKLDIRITEDITDKFRNMVVQAWAKFMTSQGAGAVNNDIASALVEEVELWTRRVKALESGDLRVCRIYALKKSRSILLSDW